MAFLLCCDEYHQDEEDLEDKMTKITSPKHETHALGGEEENKEVSNKQPEEIDSVGTAKRIMKESSDEEEHHQEPRTEASPKARRTMPDIGYNSLDFKRDFDYLYEQSQHRLIFENDVFDQLQTFHLHKITRKELFKKFTEIVSPFSKPRDKKGVSWFKAKETLWPLLEVHTDLI